MNKIAELLKDAFIWLNRNAPCAVDPKLREACVTGRKRSKVIYFFCLGIYLLGFTFANILPTI